MVTNEQFTGPDSTPTPSRKRLWRYSGLVLLTLLAFFLRVWRLDEVPPGWRDDELINVLVISQKALDGDVQLYYADASGNEGLYHGLNAIFYHLFGATPWGMRALAVIAGTLTVPALYILGRQLYDEKVGWIAAAALTFSFWSLMYSRFALRQIMTPLLAMLAFIAVWRALIRLARLPGSHKWDDLRLTGKEWLGAGVFLGLGFYVYFASRGVPLILLGFGVSLIVVARPQWRRIWPGMGVMFLTTILLVIPLFVVIGQQPEAEARVSEVGVPLNKALAGDFSLLTEYTWRTLGMFHVTGDDEWLYNIPNRPVFGLVGAIFFWLGVAIAVYEVGCLLMRLIRPTLEPVALSPYLSSLFLLLWWGAGILPGFLSVPAASLGHTIVAQPATYILVALPLWALGRQNQGKSVSASAAPFLRFILPVLAFVLISTLAWRDMTAYFGDWAERGMTRFLYRADIGDVADYLVQHPELSDFGMTGFLAGPWDRLALEVEYGGDGALRPRWYNPERALITHLAYAPAQNFTGYPVIPAWSHAYLAPVPQARAGDYTLNQITLERGWQTPICFQNGLCLVWASFDPVQQVLELGWELSRPLDLPPIPLISNPPPPGIYAGPRLAVFAQLVDEQNNFLVGDDGLWVDPVTLYPGDRWLQRHNLPLANELNPAAALFGLYDPMTGQRILTTEGDDFVRLPLGSVKD